MNRIEAQAILLRELASYRRRAHGDLASLVGTNTVVEVRGASGTDYQIEIDISWESSPDKKDVRVTGSVDDGRLLDALSPLCESFILSPDGTFVGE